MTYRIHRDGIERDMTPEESAEFGASLPGIQPPPMPTISAAQLRLALLGMGITAATVESAINAMPGTDLQREAARIQWEYATTFPRQHPLVVALGAALGLTEAQIDAAWMGAATL